MSEQPEIIGGTCDAKIAAASSEQPEIIGGTCDGKIAAASCEAQAVSELNFDILATRYGLPRPGDYDAVNRHFQKEFGRPCPRTADDLEQLAAEFEQEWLLKRRAPQHVMLNVVIGALKRAQPGRKANGRSKKARIVKKGWTQPELDAAIRDYKTRRSSKFSDLVAGVEAGRRGAIKAAQEMFGRNAVARELGVRSNSMVSKSPEWQLIARQLQLSHGVDRRLGKRSKLGLEIGMEEYATANSQTPLGNVLRSETVRAIRSTLPKEQADDLIDRSERGQITDDHVHEILKLAKEQKRDDLDRRIRSKS